MLLKENHFDSLDEFTEELGLELMSASPTDSARYVNVLPVRFDELRTYNWPAVKNGTRNDRFVLVGVYSDGSFHVSLSTGGSGYTNKRDALRAMVKAKAR